jgi:hypothetical protein
MGEEANERMTLEDCPVGLFINSYGGLCLKTEYGNNEGRIDAYIVSSGEFFWGEPPQSIASQRVQLVTPVDEDELLAATAAITVLTARLAAQSAEIARLREGAERAYGCLWASSARHTVLSPESLARAGLLQAIGGLHSDGQRRGVEYATRAIDIGPERAVVRHSVVVEKLTSSPMIEALTPKHDDWEACVTIQDHYDLMKRIIRAALAPQPGAAAAEGDR